MAIAIWWGVSHFLNLWNWRQTNRWESSYFFAPSRTCLSYWKSISGHSLTFLLVFCPKNVSYFWSRRHDSRFLVTTLSPIKFPDIHQIVTLRQILSEIYLSLSPTRLWHCGCPTNWCGRRAGWWWTRPRTGARRARSTSVLTILRWGKHQSFVFLIEKIHHFWIFWLESPLEVLKSGHWRILNNSIFHLKSYLLRICMHICFVWTVSLTA